MMMRNNLRRQQKRSKPIKTEQIKTDILNIDVNT